MTDLFQFLLALSLATLGPVAALRYLQPILLPVLRARCEESGQGAEFWLRSAYVLAVCGTLLLSLTYGEYRGDLLRTLERSLWLVAAGTFVTVAFIARQVWTPVRESRALRHLEAARAARMRAAAPTAPGA